MKKFLSFMFALLVLVPCTYFLTACGETDDTEKVMNVELNPKLEFILDDDNEVVTVNALNDDGNHILSLTVDGKTAIEAFKDMTAEEAVELFLELSKENGYLISGDDEKITISISGEADKLLDSVKSTANKYFEKIGFDINVITEAIQKSEIVSKVKECMQEYSESELNNMSEEDLIELLEESRKETKDFLTQELKEAYYALRAQEMKIAKFEALEELISSLTDSDIVQSFIDLMGDLEDAVAELQSAFVNQLLDEDSEYNKAMQAYIAEKEELLELRLQVTADSVIDETEQDALALQESAVADAKALLEKAKAAANVVITELNGVLNEAITALEKNVDDITALLDLFNVKLDNYHNAARNAKENFANKFQGEESSFKDFVGKDNGHWSNVNVEAPVNPAA